MKKQKLQIELKKYFHATKTFFVKKVKMFRFYFGALAIFCFAWNSKLFL